MPHFRSLLLALVLVALLARPADADHVQHGLRVPDGFEITEFADNKLANDIFSMTIDPKGRVVVSGPGYIRLLLDDKGDGKATRTVDIANPPEGAQGLLWEGDSLYYMAEGGLRRYTIKDDRGYGTSTLLRAMKTGGEHASHAIKRGPDGWLYVLVGNNAGLDQTFPTTASSPIKVPVAGGVMRFSPDFKTCEVVVDGYRNAYDMDFNLDGELFTFDSDNERCVGLPWYEPVRFYHVLPGEHYGWLSPQRGNFWRLPAYDADTVAPLATFGRGSPTGVVCYRHLQFPEAYRGGIFLADWTFGRIYFTKLKPAGATYSCEKQTFLEAVGDEGFAPTALAVHPQTGDLYISIGGRGTRGAVYRIRYTKGGTTFPAADLAKSQMAHRSLDWQDALATELPKQARSDNAFERRRALEELRRQREHFKPAILKEAVLANGDHADRSVRFATAELLAVLDAESQQEVGKQAKTAWQDLTYGQAVFATAPADALERATKRLADKELPAEVRLTAVRVIQMALGDLVERKYFNTIWEGYTPRKGDLDARLVAAALPVLRSAFPSGHNNLDREISRTLAVVQDDAPETLTQVADRLTEGSLALEDIHYLTVLGRLRAPRPAAVTGRVAGALLALDQKVTRDRLGRDTNWPLRIGELHTELAVKDTQLNAALIAHATFGRPDHALFAQGAGIDQKRAAEIFLEKATKDKEYAWNGRLVTLIGTLPADKALPPLRKLWGQAGLDESILPVLGRYAEAGDRDRFLSGLNSPSAATVRVCVEALEKLPASPATEENLLALVQAMRRLGTTNDEKQLEERIAKFLRKLTGKEDVALDRKAWVDWFAKTYPKLAPRLNGPDGVDVAAWTKRLARVDWTAGDVPRGQALFTKVGCAACHSGAQALGPDLKGVAGRFSRDDLLTAIIQPSKDISARYRTTVLETADGRVYQGLIIYEAPDSVLLQTGPATTVRVVNTQVASRRTSDLSLMPAGLLDPLKEGEIADLLAYLKSLGTAEAPKK